MRILYAEDERDLNDLVTRRLVAEGYGVDSCLDGQQAWDYLQAADYDAAILDIMMPHLDRLRVLTRSQFGAGDSRLVAGDLTLDTGTRRVKRGGAEIALSAREYALLEYLMHNKGIVLSREKIENHVWNFDYEGGTNVVDVYIRYLRKKIADGQERKLIHTVRGMGYVLREETP